MTSHATPAPTAASARRGTGRAVLALRRRPWSGATRRCSARAVASRSAAAKGRPRSARRRIASLSGYPRAGAPSRSAPPTPTSGPDGAKRVCGCCATTRTSSRLATTTWSANRTRRGASGSPRRGRRPEDAVRRPRRTASWLGVVGGFARIDPSEGRARIVRCGREGMAQGRQAEAASSMAGVMRGPQAHDAAQELFRQCRSSRSASTKR